MEKWFIGIALILLAWVAVEPIFSGYGVLDTSVDQSSLCLFSTDQQARRCEAGQLGYFKPTQERSPQALLNVAAAYCDFNYPVLHNDGGIICVITRERLSLVNQ